MEKKEYYKQYIKCYEKVIEICELIKNFLYPGQYTFKKLKDMDLSIKEKIDYIREDLENMSFVEEIGYQFSQLLQIYFPKEDNCIEENYDTMKSHFYDNVENLYGDLKYKYLPFIKNMTILYFPEQGKKFSPEAKWDISLKNEGTVEELEKKIGELIWLSMDTSKAGLIDDFLKNTYHLDEIEFNRYISGNTGNNSSISRMENDESKINVNFKNFDIYFEDIFGQDEAIKTIKKVLKRSILFYNAEDLKEEVNSNQGALATFMFYGPTGTGKTEAAKLIADFIFGNKNQFLLLDMNSYKDSKVASSSLKGHPEGYVDSDKGTDFTRFLAKNDKGVIVLDEFEKADRSVRELFMTMLDEGYFKDALGNTYDLSGYIFIATTNASDKVEHRRNKIGFGCSTDEEEIKEHEENIKDKLREIFTSPIMNRFNNLVHFKKIEYNDAKLICQNIINKMCDKISNKKFGKIQPKITINNVDKISEVILKECNFEKDGVRSLKNVINDLIGNEIIELIADDKENIILDCKNNKIEVKNFVKSRM